MKKNSTKYFFKMLSRLIFNLQILFKFFKKYSPLPSDVYFLWNSLLTKDNFVHDFLVMSDGPGPAEEY